MNEIFNPFSTHAIVCYLPPFWYQSQVGRSVVSYCLYIFNQVVRFYRHSYQLFCALSLFWACYLLQVLFYFTSIFWYMCVCVCVHARACVTLSSRFQDQIQLVFSQLLWPNWAWLGLMGICGNSSPTHRPTSTICIANIEYFEKGSFFFFLAEFKKKKKKKPLCWVYLYTLM